MDRRTEIKLSIMTALERKQLDLFALTLAVDVPGVQTSMGYVGETLRMLVDDGYIAETVDSSSVAPRYQHAREFAMSDLRSKLLPIRDPVREAHEYEQTQRSPQRYRRPSEHGADLDIES